MKRHLQYLVATLLILIPAAAAAADPATVRVALLDMSSLMPVAAPGYGMMGYGMMNPGLQGQAQGRMLRGPSGPGQPGSGPHGYGMMGPGMMGGMMAIRVDRQVVKAGPVTFEVTNWSRSVLHEMLVIPVDSPNAPLPYDYTQAVVPEDQVKVLGEAADIEPNGSQPLELTLPAGSYLLVCNLPGHYAAGMVVALTVTP